MANLPVREMVLYKHGVGFFVRQGSVEGREVALTFRRDDINDVLKSLAVFDTSGGHVLGIDYQTPKNRQTSNAIILDEGESLRSLLRELVGRVCDVQFETAPGTIEGITGRIIGLDEIATQSSYQASLSVLSETGVRVEPLEALRGFTIQDEQSAQDLHYALDESMTEADRHTVTVRLDEGSHDLSVYYVAPAPAWRVSYRLVASHDADGAGTALLQGWGLFDNRLDEDLNDVRLTLVAGQAISFIYDLYTSHIPTRPTIADESRAAAGPVQFDDATHDSASVPPAPQAMAMMASSAPQKRQIQRKELAESTPAQATGSEAGELFQYTVTAPVTVKRGQSALVPIIGKEIAYQRELLYNSDKFAHHPVAALRFTNDTDLTLERGPVTVIEDGDYKGEAIIPFTRADGTVYVPYAIELGIQISQNNHFDTTVAGIKVADQAVFEQVYHTSHTVYTLENRTRDDRVVTIEVSKRTGFDLHDTPEPVAETANEMRWQVSVAAQSRTTFSVKMRQLLSQRKEVIDITYQQLAKYISKRWIDEALYDHLREILTLRQQIRSSATRINTLNDERQQLYDQQEQLRANLGALQPRGEESHLRKRLLNDLEQSQDRLDAIARAITDEQTSIERNEAQVTSLVKALA